MKNLIGLLVILSISKLNFSAEIRCDFLIFNESCLDNSCETSVDGSTNDGGDISLWIKAGPTFKYLKFTMIKDRFFYSVEQEESLVIKNLGLIKDQWNKVDFTIIIKEILYWPDKYSLKAIVNDQDTYIVDTDAWVAITSVLMTRVYISGEAEISFSCLPKASTKTSITPFQDSAEVLKTSDGSDLSITSLQGSAEVLSTSVGSKTSITSFQDSAEVLSTSVGSKTSITSFQDSDEVLSTSVSSETSITSFHDSDEALRTEGSSEISVTSFQDNGEIIRTSDGETPVTTATKNVTFSPALTIDADKLAITKSNAPSFERTSAKAKISTAADIFKPENFQNDVKLFWNAKPIIEIHDVTLVLSLFAIIVALCVFLPTLFIYFTMHLWYKGKLKKLGRNDLSNIESLDPKNMINHYEDVLKCGNKDKNNYFYEEQKDNLGKDIPWIPAKDLMNSKTDQKKDDLCFNNPNSAKSETNETIYEELPRDLKQ